ncbi:MAG: hypothetical protein JWM11_7440 [Planctomycetaceae bacterium]|nr:hypothetical protein [Planctomycetaceae bacterium]
MRNETFQLRIIERSIHVQTAIMSRMHVDVNLILSTEIESSDYLPTGYWMRSVEPENLLIMTVGSERVGLKPGSFTAAIRAEAQASAYESVATANASQTA